MSDGVKFIFKTLIKIPCIICVIYAIFNIFFFSLTYFKMLGVSYAVMQTAIENNYIPESERLTLQGYIDSITQGDFVYDAKLICDANGDGVYSVYDNSGASGTEYLQRTQYGSTVKVGVTFKYKMIWPLKPMNEININDPNSSGVNVLGSVDTNNDGKVDGNDGVDVTLGGLKITYEVPGLKYYPDLLTY